MEEIEEKFESIKSELLNSEEGKKYNDKITRLVDGWIMSLMVNNFNYLPDNAHELLKYSVKFRESYINLVAANRLANTGLFNDNVDEISEFVYNKMDEYDKCRDELLDKLSSVIGNIKAVKYIMDNEKTI